MSVFRNTPLTADAILPPEWYATHTDPPAEPESEVESVVEEDDSRTEEPETEAPAQASQEEEAKPESTAAPATKAPVTTVPDTTIPDTTIPGTTGSAAAVTAVPTTAPPASKSGGDNFLVNALFVVIPLLLAAILAVIGIVLVKERTPADGADVSVQRRVARQRALRRKRARKRKPECRQRAL